MKANLKKWALRVSFGLIFAVLMTLNLQIAFHRGPSSPLISVRADVPAAFATKTPPHGNMGMADCYNSDGVLCGYSVTCDDSNSNLCTTQDCPC